MICSNCYCTYFNHRQTSDICGNSKYVKPLLNNPHRNTHTHTHTHTHSRTYTCDFGSSCIVEFSSKYCTSYWWVLMKRATLCIPSTKQTKNYRRYIFDEHVQHELRNLIAAVHAVLRSQGRTAISRTDELCFLHTHMHNTSLFSKLSNHSTACNGIQSYTHQLWIYLGNAYQV